MAMVQSSRLLLEDRLRLLFGTDSGAMRALELVVDEMSAKHGYRRYNGDDYYMHCVDVAMFLINYGIKDEDAIIAGLLHDVIEDVPGYTETMLARMFSPTAAHYVNVLSTKPGLDYHDPEVLQAYLDEIAANPFTAAIKTADRMHNICTLGGASIEKRYKKVIETEEFFVPFFKRCRKAYPKYSALFQAAKVLVLPPIEETKAHYNDYVLLNRYRAKYGVEIENPEPQTAE